MSIIHIEIDFICFLSTGKKKHLPFLIDALGY
nr:MAG TPA: hypothetical protein [Caudoviricetes sp.]